MFLDELADNKNFLFNCDVQSEHTIFFNSNCDLNFNLDKKYKRLFLNFSVDQAYSDKIDIEIYADDLLVGAYNSIYDKKFLLNCDLNYCSVLTIKSKSDNMNAIIYDSFLFESAPELSKALLSKSEYIKNPIKDKNAIIIPINNENKKFLLTCLNFLREFSGLLDDYKIYVLSSGDFSEIENLCLNFNATELKLVDDNLNSFIFNISNFLIADKYIFINPKTLIVDSLLEIDSRLNQFSDKVHLAKEQGISRQTCFGQIIDGSLLSPYYGCLKDLELLSICDTIYNSGDIWNGGVFACNYKSLLIIESYIKNCEKQLIDYLKSENNEFRTSAILNLILIKCDLAIELPAKYNIQLYHDDCTITINDNKELTFIYKDKKVSLLYFNGLKSDYKYNKLKNYAFQYFKSPMILQDNNVDKNINYEFTHLSSIQVEALSKSFETIIFTFVKEDEISKFKIWLHFVGRNINFPICVINVNSNETISNIIQEFGCYEVCCRDISQTGAYYNLIYAIQKFVNAENFIYVDLNCSVFENITSDIYKFLSIDNNKIYLSGENFKDKNYNNLRSLLWRGHAEDPFTRIQEFGLSDDICLSDSLLNCNFFIANKKILNDIYDKINSFNEAFKYWAVSNVKAYKFIFNYALVLLNNFEELDISYNFVLQNNGRAEIWREKNRPKAKYLNTNLKILNFENKCEYLLKYLSIYPTFIDENLSDWQSFTQALKIFFDLSEDKNLIKYFYPNCDKEYPKYQLNFDSFINFINNFISIRECKNILEAGSGSGLFTAALACMLPKNGSVICVEDPLYIGNLPFFWYLPYSILNKIKFLTKHPEDVFDQFIENNQKFDAVFINGNYELEECYSLSIKGRQLLDPGSPLVVHTPGRDVEKLNFISSRFNERGYAAVSFTSKYSKEDSINYMICSDKVNLNTKHKITIMTYLDAVNTKVFNFAQSIRSTNYPLNKIQIIIIMNKDCPAIKQYFSDLDVASIDYIEVKKETNMSWHEGLIFYLKNHQNYGLLLWRQNLITDENFIDNMCNQNCAASQPLICHKDNPKIVKASKFIKHQNTAVHLDMNELNKNFFIDWIENAPIFAIRSQWLMLAKNDGFKYMNLDTNVGLEGWLFKTLRTKSYLVKNTSAWILNDNNVGFKAIIKNDEVKIYQKQFLYNV